jgi:hypothetical protein
MTTFRGGKGDGKKTLRQISGKYILEDGKGL